MMVAKQILVNRVIVLLALFCSSAFGDTCQELLHKDPCNKTARFPAFSLSVDCVTNTFILRRDHQFHFPTFSYEEKQIVEVVMDYNCTNLSGEKTSGVALRKTVFQKNKVKSTYKVINENFSTCNFGACMVFEQNPCWYLNEDSESCSQNTPQNSMIVDSLTTSSKALQTFMDTTTTSIPSMATFYQSSYQSNQLSSSILLSSSMSPFPTTSKYSIQSTSYQIAKNLELEGTLSIITASMVLAISLALLIAVSIVILLMQRVSSSRKRKIIKVIDRDESDHQMTNTGYIDEVIGDVDVINGSIATVYEDIVFKDLQPYPKEQEFEFQARAKENAYFIATNLCAAHNERSNFTAVDDHCYLNKLSINILSASNAGKPTNIDDYLEIFKLTKQQHQ